MSDKVRAWGLRTGSAACTKLVMLWLAGRATDGGVAFPGEREIRDKTGLGERMVRYHIRGLTAVDMDRPDPNPGPLLFRIEGEVCISGENEQAFRHCGTPAASQRPPLHPAWYTIDEAHA